MKTINYVNISNNIHITIINKINSKISNSTGKKTNIITTKIFKFLKYGMMDFFEHFRGFITHWLGTASAADAAGAGEPLPSLPSLPSLHHSPYYYTSVTSSFQGPDAG